MKRIALLVCLLLPALSSAQEYMGDIIVGQTVERVYPLFSTAGAPVERTTAGTPSCYENGGTTEITAGVTDSGLTEFDGKVGMNLFTVVATAANGFESGKRYSCGNKDAELNSNANMWIPVLDFTVEDRYPLKGLILARGTIAAGSTTTVANVGAFLTFENQWQTRVILDVNTGERQIVTSSHDAGGADTITFAAAVPVAWTMGDVFYILGESPQYVLRLPNLDSAGNSIVGAFVDVTHPINARTADNWITFNYNANAASTLTLADVGSQLSTIRGETDFIGNPPNLGLGATIAANQLVASGVQAYGTCDAMSTTTTCRNVSLTQADSYWNNWTMIVVAGQPSRCIRGFTAATDQLSWPQALPSTAASQTFILLAAPECRNAP